MKWSSYQKDIFDWIQNGSGNARVVAGPGAGKTATIKQGVKRIPQNKQVVYLVFNKTNATEANKKFKDDPMIGSNVQASTLHSLAYGALLGWLKDTYPKGKLADSPPKEQRKEGVLYGNNGIAEDKCWRLALQHAKANISVWNVEEKYARKIAASIKDVVDMARNTLTDLSVPEEFYGMCMTYNMRQTVKNEDLFLLNSDQLRLAALSVLNKSNDLVANDSWQVLDFTDMIYAIYKFKISMPKFDFVFVDEAQDLNRLQHYLVQQVVADSARVMAVGDPMQSIYAFTGADPKSFERIGDIFNMKTFGLPVSYRCPVNVLDLARSINPSLRNAPNAPLGEVREIEHEMIEEEVRGKKDCIIVSRKNAPLLKLIGAQIPAKLLGFSIVYALLNLCKDVMKRRGVEFTRIAKVLDTYEASMAETMQRENHSEASIEIFRDKVESLRLALAHFKPPDFKEFGTQLRKMCSKDNAPVLLMSAHKSKGLEAKTVIIIEPGDFPLEWKGQSQMEKEQERNLLYVAITRAQETLIFAGARPHLLSVVKEQPESDAVEEPTVQVVNIEPEPVVAVQQVTKPMGLQLLPDTDWPAAYYAPPPARTMSDEQLLRIDPIQTDWGGEEYKLKLKPIVRKPSPDEEVPEFYKIENRARAIIAKKGYDMSSPMNRVESRAKAREIAKEELKAEGVIA